jgi:hypothetical protein
MMSRMFNTLQDDYYLKALDYGEYGRTQTPNPRLQPTWPSA